MVDIKEKKYPVPVTAEFLAIKPKTLWAHIGNGSVSVYRIGRSVRIGENEIKRILEDGFTQARNAA